jgi:hypothetical protein
MRPLAYVISHWLRLVLAWLKILLRLILIALARRLAILSSFPRSNWPVNG